MDKDISPHRMFLAALTALALLLALAGCGSASSKVSAAAEELLSGVQALSDETFNEDVSTLLGLDDLESYGVDSGEFLASYLDGFTYAIEGVSVDGDTAVVTLSVTCKSYDEFHEAFSSVALDIPLADGASELSDEELNAQYAAALLECLEEAAFVESGSIELDFTRADGTWTADEGWQAVLATALIAL